MAETPRIVEETLSKARTAAAVFSQLDQEQTDRIVRAVFKVALDNRIRLAKMAHEETQMGNWQDKVVKNLTATLNVYDDIRYQKTVGIISLDRASGIAEIAQPLGPILAIIPVTNPTSTTIFKILIALKTRNPIIISAHHKALNCCRETVSLLYKAALGEDAPEDCIQFFERASREETKALMADRRLALVLATGGESVVKAAYSSGTPALGVGAGNVPVFIDETADVPFAVEQIFASKTFDYGTICASEQALVVPRSISDQVAGELKKRGAYFLDEDQTAKVSAVAYDREKRVMNAEVIGQPVEKIAAMAGIAVPPGTKLLMARLKGVGADYPLSSEILAPILGYYEAADFDSAVNLCIDLNFHGGIGHSVSIFSNDDERTKKFALMMNAGRIVVNQPSSQGAIGGIYNTLHTSLTLGCGTGGKNITTDNVTAKHLLNIQRICWRRVSERVARLDGALVFDESTDATALEKAFNRNY